jgi:hypothetical protein
MRTPEELLSWQVEEIQLHANNDYGIVKHFIEPYFQKLETRMEKGNYKQDKAIVGMKTILDIAYAKYLQDFKSPKNTISVGARKIAAKDMIVDFEYELKVGNSYK